MLGYLFYDVKDIERNQSFISWLIETAERAGITLTLQGHNAYKDLEPPDFIINRSRYYEISDYFNVPSFNEAQVTRIANDKFLTYEFFKDIVPMKRTSKIPFFPSIVKSTDGHGGTEVFLANDETDLHLDDCKEYIYQEINSVLGKDLRVYILDNKIVTSILRFNPQDFKSNYSLGGQTSLYTLRDIDLEVIQTILNKLPIHYGGIDFLLDEENNLILNEIEDPVGARMLYNLTDINIVELFIQSIKKKLTHD